MLDELKDALDKIKTDVKADDKEKSATALINSTSAEWVKYANRMRMRLAIRAAVNTATKTEFEDAAKGAYLREW